MKYVLIVLMLSGCAVSDSALKEAEKLCKDHSGIKYVYGHLKINTVDVVCNDNISFESRVEK